MSFQLRTSAVLLAAIACLCSPACTIDRGSQPGPDPSGFTVTDALGRKVLFERPPRRVVLAGRGIFMVVNTLYMFPGVHRNVVAMENSFQGSTDFVSRIDPKFREKLVLVENAGPEPIAAHRPDVVILKSYMEKTLGSRLELLSIPVVYVDFETPEQYGRDLRTLGELFHQTGRAAELVEYYRSGVRRIRDAISAVPEKERPRVLVLYYSKTEGAATFNIPPDSWIQTVMAELSGGIPVWKSANPAKGWSRVSQEQIFAWDPDVVFVTSYTVESRELVRTLQGDANWRSTRAFKSGRVYAFAADFQSWDQPDPRWILGLAWMARKLHPDRFQGLDIIAFIREFYQKAYGVDESSFEQSVRPALRGDFQ